MADTVQEYGFKGPDGRIDAGGLLGLAGRKRAIDQACLDSGAAHYGWQVVTRTLRPKQARLADVTPSTLLEMTSASYGWEAPDDQPDFGWAPDPTVPVTVAYALTQKARDLADQAADILTQAGWEAGAFTEASAREAQKLQAEAIHCKNALAVILAKSADAQGLQR